MAAPAKNPVPPTTEDIEEEVDRMQDAIEEVDETVRKRLKELDFFCLDNSIRESTVGQIRHHTLENKVAILKQVQRCGMKDIVVASFSNMPRVDDSFCQYLKDTNEDFNNFYSFSEVTGALKDGVYDTETLPAALPKNKKFGLGNVFFEVDLADKNCDWEVKFTTDDMCKLLHKLIKWVKDEIRKDGRNLLNLRDLPLAMTVAPERLLTIVKFLSRLPDHLKLFALCFEDPMGEYLPDELGAWTASLRRVMDANGWKDGKILVHIHEKWEFQTASQIECLSSGADGVWAGLCMEGAAMGHACSTVTMMNLVRMGNQKILEKYDCTELRDAAIQVTKLTTGKKPDPKQCVYGERAADLVFGFLGIGNFDLAKFFGIETPNRITSLATPQMIVDRMVNLFGPDEQFTLEMADKMKAKMIDDLVTEKRKEEYMSKVGLAMLFDRAGGKMTADMRDSIATVEVRSEYHKQLIREVRDIWDEWDVRDAVQGDECLEFDSFYGAFMAPYISCYRCPDAKGAMKAIDMDADGLVDWNEFMVYIKWALNEYPNMESVDELLSTAFLKGIIPAMRDEKIKNKKDYPGFRQLLLNGLAWEKAKDGNVPKDAICGGWDSHTEEPLYIGRAKQGGSFVAGKVQASKSALIAATKEKVLKFQEYEVLVNPNNEVTIKWVFRKNGQASPNAVKVGEDSGAGYIGRGSFNNDTIPGNVIPDGERLFVVSSESEDTPATGKRYNVLVAK